MASSHSRWLLRQVQCRSCGQARQSTQWGKQRVRWRSGNGMQGGGKGNRRRQAGRQAHQKQEAHEAAEGVGEVAAATLRVPQLRTQCQVSQVASQGHGDAAARGSQQALPWWLLQGRACWPAPPAGAPQDGGSPDAAGNVQHNQQGRLRAPGRRHHRRCWRRRRRVPVGIGGLCLDPLRRLYAMVASWSARGERPKLDWRAGEDCRREEYRKEQTDGLCSYPTGEGCRQQCKNAYNGRAASSNRP